MNICEAIKAFGRGLRERYLHLLRGWKDARMYCRDEKQGGQSVPKKIEYWECNRGEDAPGKRICPIITAHTGKVAFCMGGICRMWVDTEDYMGLTAREVNGQCGFKLLSLYAGFEIDRMCRYEEIVT